MIRPEEYLKKGHAYLETQGGRREIFRLYHRVLEEGVKNQRPEDYMWVIRNLEELLTGNSILFVDTNIPNLATLRRLKPQIKREALAFLLEHLDLTEKALVMSQEARDRHGIFYVLLRFLPSALLQSPDPGPRHLVTLALATFHTLKHLDELEGTEKEKGPLATLLLMGLCRYDWTQLGRYFILSPQLQDELERLRITYRPYDDYIELLKDYTNRALEHFQGGRSSPDLLAPLSLTGDLALGFSLKWKELKEILAEEKENIHATVKKWGQSLLEEDIEEILAPMEAHLESLIAKMGNQRWDSRSFLSASTLLKSE